MTTSDPSVESPEPRPAPLRPVVERRIAFHGDTIAAVLVTVAGEPVIMVPVRPLCDRLGLDWAGQRQRILRDPVLAAAMASVVVTPTQGSQRRAVLCLPADMLHGWLFGVSAGRVRPEHRDTLNTYRAECFAVLWRAYQAGDLGGTPSRTPPAGDVGGLAGVRATALAVAALAEQQMAVEARVGHAEERLDRAAEAVGRLTRRVTAIEATSSPAELVTEAQATEISQAVKALAQLMTQRPNGAPRPYATVFGELYRRFGVTSYKHVPVGRLADVLAFLDDWRRSLLAGKNVIRPDDHD